MIRVTVFACAAACCMLVTPGRLIADACHRDWLCVETVESNLGVELFARNLQPVAITVSLRTRSRNLTVFEANPVTKTIGPERRVRLQRLRSIDGGTDWHYRYWFDWAVGSLDPDHNDDYVYRLPYASGERHRVLQGYGSHFSHKGLERYTIDFDMPVGSAVHAAREGVIAKLEASNDRACWGNGCGRHANFVVILHDDGTTGEYYHLAKGGVLVTRGERVQRGQLIALSGNTGNSTMPHLHFGVYRAATWGRTQSIAVRLATSDGVISRPRRGRRYRVGQP